MGEYFAVTERERERDRPHHETQVPERILTGWDTVYRSTPENHAGMTLIWPKRSSRVSLWTTPAALRNTWQNPV
ncbi:protein of unknown function [Methanoculleus bourgensis]|uniref:Uncharacterized protein n=1 Tax=Methanoculleus bourgensis TaxID=83986 RepID=A0A0X3BR66_9EURY|nr:protein of unknown function [Methanoculleus bourgensis]